MKFFQFSALAALAVLILTSCVRESSEDVNQDRIFTDYELFYNANQDKTYARATFRFSNATGTNLELANPSKVTFNGDMLTFNNVLAYYEKEYAGFVQSGTFVWEDLDGNTFTNDIEIHEIAYPAGGIDTIPRNAAFDLAWEGDPLADKEFVTVTVNGENELDAQIFITNDVGSQSIILAKNQLEKVGQGPGTVWMDRSCLPGLTQETGAGGKITGRYRPENLQVYFE